MRANLPLVACTLLPALIGAAQTPCPDTTAPEALNADATIDAEGDDYPNVATDGQGTWVAVWEGHADACEPDIDGNGNVGFSDLTLLLIAWGPCSLPTDPCTADLDGSGDVGFADLTAILLSWGACPADIDISFARSIDHGITWSEPAPLNTNAPLDAAADRRPHVAASATGTWLAVWSSSAPVGGSGGDEDILCARSFDGGTTWTPPQLLNDSGLSDSQSDARPRIATDGFGRWVAVWDSSALLVGGVPLGLDRDILCAISVDDGLTHVASDSTLEQHRRLGQRQRLRRGRGDRRPRHMGRRLAHERGRRERRRRRPGRDRLPLDRRWRDVVARSVPE
jgi:hypothetical protein